MSRHAALRGYGSDEHHAGAVDKSRQQRLHEKEWRRQVDRDEGIEVVARRVGEWLDAVRASRMDERAAGKFCGGFDERRAARFAAAIRDDDATGTADGFDPRRGFFERCAGASGAQHVQAALAEQNRGLTTNSASRAGHDRGGLLRVHLIVCNSSLAIAFAICS